MNFYDWVFRASPNWVDALIGITTMFVIVVGVIGTTIAVVAGYGWLAAGVVAAVLLVGWVAAAIVYYKEGV